MMRYGLSIAHGDFHAICTEFGGEIGSEGCGSTEYAFPSEEARNNAAATIVNRCLNYYEEELPPTCALMIG
jgi:hypothetical protein